MIVPGREKLKKKRGRKMILVRVSGTNWMIDRHRHTQSSEVRPFLPARTSLVASSCIWLHKRNTWSSKLGRTLFQLELLLVKMRGQFGSVGEERPLVRYYDITTTDVIGERSRRRHWGQQHERLHVTILVRWAGEREPIESNGKLITYSVIPHNMRSRQEEREEEARYKLD